MCKILRSIWSVLRTLRMPTYETVAAFLEDVLQMSRSLLVRQDRVASFRTHVEVPM